jgi:hypothetical protein
LRPDSAPSHAADQHEALDGAALDRLDHGVGDPQHRVVAETDVVELLGRGVGKARCGQRRSMTAEKSRLVTCTTPGQATRPEVKMRAW